MKGTIPRSFIDDLIARTDIVEVINSRVKLKKQDEIIKPVVLFITRKPFIFGKPIETVLSLLWLWRSR